MFSDVSALSSNTRPNCKNCMPLHVQYVVCCEMPAFVV